MVGPTPPTQEPEQNPDEPAPLSQTESTEQGESTATPQTGDSTHLLLWAVVAIISGGGVVMLLWMDRKRNKNK